MDEGLGQGGAHGDGDWPEGGGAVIEGNVLERLPHLTPRNAAEDARLTFTLHRMGQ